jgi:hypothetical protein
VKTLNRILIAMGAPALWMAAPPPASAQSVELPRGELSGTLGTQSVGVSENGLYRGNRWDGGFHGAASAGWYWTEHLKTEIDFGGRTKGRVYEPSAVTLNGTQTYYTTDRTFSRRTLGFAQEYQFFHNLWFHPYLGAGAHLAWERSQVHSAAAFAYDPQTRISRMVSPERTERARTKVFVEPFVQSGFKAYMTPRTFFRSDLRVAFRRGVDDVVVRFGFGFDF